MTMQDFWPGKGCTFHAVERQDADPVIIRHHEFLGRWHGCFPFIHSIAHIFDEWVTDDWGLDPLIIPLLRNLNAIDGVETFVSCQGGADRSTSTDFFADLPALHAVYSFICGWNRSGWYRNETIINYEGLRHKKWDHRKHRGIGEKFATWNLWFYSPLILMQFTEEKLGVLIEEQLSIPGTMYHIDKDIMNSGPSAAQIRTAIWG